MDKDYVINLVFGKEAYNQSSQSLSSSTTLNTLGNREPTYACSTKSCVVCRNTLLLSYFNCCAICLGAIKCGRDPKPEEIDLSDSLPIARPAPAHISPSSPPPSSSWPGAYWENDDRLDPRKPPHCGTPCCWFIHSRTLLLIFAAFEALSSLSALTLLNMALYTHNWAQLRFALLLSLQWWQTFVMPRQWYSGRSIIPGQIAAFMFLVWYYVESSRSPLSLVKTLGLPYVQEWYWWEPLVIGGVLLKIIFPW
ncbi:hypothetical protein F5Y04DRAFT_284472 [Hypomontagnella monticulosa]|nr:hypothetical protein F5Y04DRAFT_284472 [Hypomontagnella monticulosa]